MNKLFGHREVSRFFDVGFKADKLAGAYLLIGPSGVGKKTFVRDLICKWHDLSSFDQIGNDVDVYWLERIEGKKEISIEQIRSLSEFVNLTSWNNRLRVVVIADCDLMNAESANALLKTLEEPAPLTIFLLTTAHSRRLPLTIISRCQTVNFSPLSEEEIKGYLNNEKFVGDIDFVLPLAQGRPGRVRNLINDEIELNKRQQVVKLFTDYLLTKKSIASIDYVNDLLLKSKAGEEKDLLGQNEKLAALFSVWLEVARDVLFSKYGTPQALVYKSMAADTEKIANIYTLPNIYSIIKHISDALAKLKSNANAKLTLEWLLISIKNI